MKKTVKKRKYIKKHYIREISIMEITKSQNFFTFNHFDFKSEFVTYEGISYKRKIIDLDHDNYEYTKNLIDNIEWLQILSDNQKEIIYKENIYDKGNYYYRFLSVEKTRQLEEIYSKTIREQKLKRILNNEITN